MIVYYYLHLYTKNNKKSVFKNTDFEIELKIF